MIINVKSRTLAKFSVIAIAAIVSGIILIPQMVKATETEIGDTSLPASHTSEQNKLPLKKKTNLFFPTGTIIE